MSRFRILVYTVGILGGILITSCGSIKQDATVAFSEYIASAVSPTSDYKVIKPMTATASVEYTPGASTPIPMDRKIHIDGKLVYDYKADANSYECQWLKNFNASRLELGFISGSGDENNVTHPNPRALARQLAYAKIIKELIAVGGDAITTPVISTEIVGNSYQTTISTNLIKYNLTK